MSWVKQKKSIIILAPMADLTDSPFCRICREVSGYDFVIFREMVSAEALVRNNEKTWKMCRFNKREKPLVIQIFGGNAKHIAEAAEKIVKKNKPDGIDINMGCPVPKIAGKSNAGASLMKDHDRAIGIIKAIKKLNLGVPITVKTRLGWSGENEILDFAPQLEKAGVDLITIHGRTKNQGYSGKAKWEMIARVKKLVSIPVIANGDIQNLEDIKKCLAITKADGVMIGRAALGNPWIFSGKIPTVKEIKKVVLKHAKLHLKHYGVEFGLTTFRKHLLAYFKGLPNISGWRLQLAQVKDLDQLKEILKKIPE